MCKPRAREAGFSLLEMMLAVALTAAIFAALSMLAAQWLPNWRRGFADAQRADALGVGLERIVEDLQAARYVSPNSGKAPLFDGETLSVTFVRDAIGPDETPHLELVRIAEEVQSGGFALVRRRAPFLPQAGVGPLRLTQEFSDPVVLTRAPFRVSFAFAGPQRIWLDAWRYGQETLPTAVRITVRDAVDGKVLAASTAATLHVTASVDDLAQPAPKDEPPAGPPEVAPGAAGGNAGPQSTQ